MNILLDTHIAIWALASPHLLGDHGRALIADEANDIVVSAASVWEIAIKHALGKRPGAPPFSASEAVASFADAGYRMLAITPAHAAAVETLPPHHTDPFDRILVAQALTEPLRLLTADPWVARYSDLVIQLG